MCLRRNQVEKIPGHSENLASLVHVAYSFGQNCFFEVADLLSGTALPVVLGRTTLGTAVSEVEASVAWSGSCFP